MGQDAGFHRKVLLGVRAYAGHSKRWLFHSASPKMAAMRPLAEWNPHGIIVHLDDAKVARAILKLGKPVVDTGCMLQGSGHPGRRRGSRRRSANWPPIISLPADINNSATFGSGLVRYSRLRLASFREAVDRAGFAVHSCHIEYLPHLSDRASWKSVSAQVRRWLKELKTPVAVLADHDSRRTRSGRHVPIARPARARRRCHPRRGRRRVGMPVGLSAPFQRGDSG